MDSTDDDFGELYVDDKVPASAAFAGENKGFEGTVKPEAKKFGGEACAVNRSETNEVSEYSDSEDDLNIVLKEDDSKALPVACGSSGGGYVETSQTWCAMPNSGMVNGGTTMDASANYVWMNPSLGMPQSGFNFSHTWSRTPFDAYLHVFDKKPWRNSGTDINDFFNFGFNEQSWKDYCNPLLKGRPIEVEGGTPGRTPSVNLRHPRDLDPDVVIQIPVTNDVEELSSMAPMEARSLSQTSNKASTSEEFHSDIGADLNSSGDSMKEDVSVGREDENTGSLRGDQSPPKKKNCCSREATPCDKEIIEEEKEETCWNSDKADSSSMERGSSLRDRFRFSPTSSYSVGKTEESEDSETESSKGGATDDQQEASTPPQRTRFAEHEANNIKSGEMSGTKHSRHRRSHEDSNKWHSGRVDYGVHRRTKDAIFKDASSTPDPNLGKRVCSGRESLYRDSSKNWQNGPLSTFEKVGIEVRGFPHLNREKRQGRSYSSVELDRDREHRFGWRNNKEISHGRGFDHSNGYKYEARLKEYSSLSSFNPNHRNSRLSFNKEEDRYGRQHCERKYGRERSPGLAYESNTERDRYDWLGEPYYQDRIPITDMEYRYRLEYYSANRRHSPKQSRENDLLCRRRGDYDYSFHRHRYEDGFHRAESGISFDMAYREMYSFAEVRRRESERYEINEEFSEIDRRRHCTPDWHHDRFVSKNDGHNKYRIQDAWPSPSLSFRDSWYTKGSRGDSWRDDTRDFTTREYDRQNNQLCKDAPRDSWTQNLVHSDNVSIQDRLRYDDNCVRRDRRRYQLEDDIQSSMREVTHSENPSYTDEMLVPDIRMSTHIIEFLQNKGLDILRAMFMKLMKDITNPKS